jgi:hypothetical protein
MPVDRQTRKTGASQESAKQKVFMILSEIF